MLKRDESMKPPDARRDVSADAFSRGSAEKIVMDLGKSLVIKGELRASEDLGAGTRNTVLTFPGTGKCKDESGSGVGGSGLECGRIGRARNAGR
jgi:hypothetical protein